MRPPTVPRWLPVVVLIVGVLAAVFPALMGKAIGPVDQIRQFAPWNGPRPEAPWDVLQADGVLQFMVWRDLVLSSWGQGILPAWNPYQFAGAPLLANSQSGALYLPHILLGVLKVPTTLAIGLLAWFHPAVAALGAAALSRRLGASRIGGGIAGLSFALSPFLLGWLALASVPATVAWIPWVLAALAEGFAEPSDGPIRRIRALLPLFVALMVTAGHLQFVAYGLMAAVSLVVALTLTGRPAREAEAAERLGAEAAKTYVGGARTGYLLGSTVLLGLGLLLAAPHLLPVLEFSAFSHRRGAATPEGYAAYLGSALPLNDLVARLANPMAQGNPTVAVSADAPFSTYWPALARPGANFAEFAATVGPLVLLLNVAALFGGLRWREILPMALVGLVGLLIAMGSPLNALLYFNVPGWSGTGSPNRAVVLFVLAACVRAGVAFGEVLELDRRRLGYGLGAGAVLSLLTLAFARPGDPPAGVSTEAWTALAGPALSESLGPFLVAVLLAAGAVALCVNRTGTRPYALAVPVLLASVLGVTRLVRFGEPLAEVPVRPADPMARVAIVNEPWEFVQAAPAALPPNLAALARIHDVAGYDSLIHRETKAMLDAANGQDSAPPTNGNLLFVKPSADPSKLAELGVSEIWSRAPVPTLGEAPAFEGGLYQYRLSGPGRAFTPQGPARIVRENLGEVVVEATGPGRLVLRDRIDKGWTATIDGRPAAIQGDRWREVDLEAGTHTVVFRYQPPGLGGGLLLSSLAALASLLLGAVGVFTRRTQAGMRSVQNRSETREPSPQDESDGS